MNRIDPFALAALSALALLGTACMSGMTGGVDKIVASADRSDPVRAAVVEVLASEDQDFAPVLGGPLSAGEQRQMIDRWLAGDYLDQAQSRMDTLRSAEAAAQTARHVNATIEGTDVYYWRQTAITSSATSDQKFITWNFDVPFSERTTKADELVSRLAPFLAIDPKWMVSGVSDPILNSIFVQTTFSTFLSMSATGSSTVLMVSIDYAHSEKNHNARHGVVIKLAKLRNKRS
jgi:hypothetical protein